MILAHGQTLYHEFVLRNPTDRHVRLLGLVPSTPCCSTAGPIFDGIEPGSSVRLPVTFHAGWHGGRKRLEFALHTDQRRQPIVWFAFEAQLFSEYEITEEAGSSAVVPLGRPGRLRLKILCRRSATEGRPAPDQVRVDPPLQARLVAESETESERTGPEGLRESSRQIEVELPASEAIGPKRSTATLHWKDPAVKPLPVPLAWRVVPLIAATPAGLVLHEAGPQTQDILLHSATETFRVLAVEGADASDLPSLVPARSQRVRLRFRGGNPADRTVRDLTFQTDHPLQPQVVVSVMFFKAESPAEVQGP